MPKIPLLLKCLAGVSLALTSGCTQLHWDKAADATVLKCTRTDAFTTAITQANQAANLAQTAQSTQDWDLVVLSWLRAIAAMQSIQDSRRTFAQKKVTEYTYNLRVAQQKVAQIRTELPFSSFSSEFLNQQLLLYLSYTAAVGAPDILIIGSSRAVQGIEPRQLQVELARRGKPGQKIFNFGVNGATAQVVELIIRQIIPSQHQPKLIIWGDGARAFNSGRVDRTYNAIASSPGYQQLIVGNRPQLPTNQLSTPEECQQLPNYLNSQLQSLVAHWKPARAMAADVNQVDANGFLPMPVRFDPTTYYQQYPRVAGLYDGDYQNFNLGGEQAAALERLVSYTKQREIPLVFVSLPLTRDYLDRARRGYEQQFRSHMQRQASVQGFVFFDFSEKLLNRNDFFADPSHLNRYGAIAVSQQLAANFPIPFP